MLLRGSSDTAWDLVWDENVMKTEQKLRLTTRWPAGMFTSDQYSITGNAQELLAQREFLIKKHHIQTQAESLYCY